MMNIPGGSLGLEASNSNLPYRSSREGNGNHSRIIAWRISWTEEPGRLQSMGSQRIRHDRETNTYLHLVYSLYP